MRIRKGFVSNSSSTSYIIAFKKGDPCPHCGRSDPNFVEMIGRSQWHKTKIVIIGWDKIFALWEQYPSSVESDKIHEYEKQYRNDDWIVAEVDIAYGDENLEKMIRESDDIVVLQSDEEEPEGGW